MSFYTGSAGDYLDLLLVLTVRLRQEGWITERETKSTESITGVDTTNDTFTVGTDLSSEFSVGDHFEVTGSTGNDGLYEITDISTDGQTFTVSESVSDSTADGTIDWYGAENEVIFNGPGLSGSEQIFAGIKPYNYSSDDVFNWELDGFTDFNSSSGFNDQPGSISEEFNHTSLVALDNDTINYWIAVNGQRVIMVAGHNSVYEQMYLGFYNTYGSPGQYPYPLLIGGSLSGQYATSTGNNSDERYSVVHGEHSAYWNPGNNSGTTLSSGRSSGALFRTPGGEWMNMINFKNGDEYETANEKRGVTSPYLTNNDMHDRTPLKRIRSNHDGSYTILPINICGRGVNDGSGESTPNVFGELDGCFFVSGFGLSSEDVITINSTDYTVFQNIYRTEIDQYFCVEQV